ncbi:alpha/beta fold hydrolase [Nocardioides mangrovicus]|uniref:Alpha/beta fold hydrolase n=1 Tax=Nocardioides mangrovicus TaxID=2478913 RepID=A0A3L8P715_9ACTN|nr:alpha/beta hydrolase [Nocardioides mangrovicus]RLV50722.1 alpha/beta fold hydrolase [Nocardioides mangrovicus]
MPRPPRKRIIAAMRRRLLVGLVTVLLVSATTSVVHAVTPRRVGSLALHRCRLGVAAWCGSLHVPLDYTDASAGTIRIGFGWLPARGRPTGTVVAEEGGPGYPSTGTAADYAAMLGGLRRHRNLLVVDARGTGRSTPLDCRSLQWLRVPSPRIPSRVAACGQQLDHTFRRADGSYVHASDLFTTANTARDLARVLDALGLGTVDLYGDSYGTYVAQSFLSRYPGRLRSVVLDSAYEARDLDPWYRTTPTTAHRAFDIVCRRAAHCHGSTWRRLGRTVRRLRRHHDGRDVTALVNIVNDAGYDTYPYEHLDPALRAYLRHGDLRALRRLYARDIAEDYSDYVRTPASYYSDGLYFAVACSDYPQLFDMGAAPAQRRQQLDASIAALPADTFAPFTTREWLRMLPYTETYTACLDWPTPTHAADPPVPDGASMDATGVPVLVLNGELDSLTPAVGGAHVAAQIGPAAQAYVAANNVHLVALDATTCGARVVRRFLTDPRRRPRAGCLGRIPALRVARG